MAIRLCPSFLCAALALGALGAQAGDIVRCVAANGAVTYQMTACPESSREQLAGIASEYPAPNLTERERLLANERDMYKRLEAQRDRDNALEMARQARAREAEAAAAADAEPYYLAWPARAVRPVHHQRVARGNQPVWTGGNPLSPGFSR